MAHLSELQIEKIKEHMLHEEDALKSKFKAKSSQFDTMKVLHAEVETYENQGWIASTPLKTKTPISRRKKHDRQFEDDVWCMFYNLGFRILNSDEKLRVQWGDNPGEDKQIDILAVGEDAIFVVECKSAEKSKRQSFQQALMEMSRYKNGMTESLQQIYGKTKRVKYIFATRNFIVEEDGDDAQRMKNDGIYHLDERAYDYINNLVKSYQSSVIYQFYGLMFKNELISDKTITIPALKGTMGGKNYYLFSIEPSTLLKIGFVLHRTKVNDSMAPTYQRLLVPKRLKGISKFIDDGGFFPNSIILNFADPNEKIKVSFDPIHKEKDSDAEFGLLNIPNAYGIAYIIDGQHRVYGYSNSIHKNDHTIPVVAFQNMESEEQLRIFMEINENQKKVDKNLRLDLEVDLYWDSKRLDSRMKALRSSTIQELNSISGSILYNKITRGADKAELSSDYFDNGLIQSGLIPKAKQTKWLGDTDACLYDVNETDVEKAMKDARKRIVQYLTECYEIADNTMTEETKNTFLMSNRASFTFVAMSGILHTFAFNCGEINKNTSIKDRVKKVAPYIEALCEGLNNISNEDYSYLTGAQGQGAEKKWLLHYKNIINKRFPEYSPEELIEWKETRDQDLQNEGDKLKDDIRSLIKTLVFEKLYEVLGDNMEKSIARLRHDCEGKIYAAYSDNDDFDITDYDWKDWIDIPEYKAIIAQYYPYDVFSDVFGIALTDKATSKKDKLSWISLVEQTKGKKKAALTKSDVNRLWLIHDHLNKFIPTEE